MIIYFQKPFLTIYSHEPHRLGYVQWKRFENSYEYRSGLEAVLALAHDKQVQNWIFDLKNMSAVRMSDQQWTANEYLPRFFRTNFQKIALIGGEDFFSRTYIHRMREFMPPLPDLQVNYVPDFDAAMDWICFG
ncbi:MAG TPA: hypothetical protein VK927_09420 [Adhaeribacter sp.]|nr:hypothetical protein [Adhaeribacter sp.]